MAGFQTRSLPCPTQQASAPVPPANVTDWSSTVPSGRTFWRSRCGLLKAVPHSAASFLANNIQRGAHIKTTLLFGAIVLCGFSISFGAQVTSAQGPAGAGAAGAAQDTPISLNPIKWVKKDPKNSDAPANRTDAEKKLTPVLQGQGVLPATLTSTEACSPFTALDGCLAALHASHNLGVDFNCLRAGVTGVHVTADLGGCKLGEKAQSLNRAIHELKPDANAKQAAKDAEQQAKDDLKNVAS
jgi:hypothetical protein